MLTELPFEYLEKLAKQTILISSLLAGFSITVLANFLIAKNNGRIENTILKIAATAAGSFLISIFAFTDILLSIQSSSHSALKGWIYHAPSAGQPTFSDYYA